MLNLIKTEMCHVEGLKTVNRVAGNLPEQDPGDNQAVLRSCEQLEKVISNA